MTRRIIRYSAAELRWIESNARRPRPESYAEFCVIFGREDVRFENYAALCKRNGWLTGNDGRFQKGGGSSNKGKTRPFNANSAATQFKPGTVPPNRKPLGDERLDRDGYIEIKVPLPNPYTGHSTRYMHKHRYLWEQVNGPLPKGMALKCLDGDRTNTAPSNWAAVPRSLLPRLNGVFGRNYDAAPAELKPAIMAIAKLKHAASERRRGPKSSRPLKSRGFAKWSPDPDT